MGHFGQPKRHASTGAGLSRIRAHGPCALSLPIKGEISSACVPCVAAATNLAPSSSLRRRSSSTGPHRHTGAAVVAGHRPCVDVRLVNLCATGATLLPRHARGPEPSLRCPIERHIQCTNGLATLCETTPCGDGVDNVAIISIAIVTYGSVQPLMVDLVINPGTPSGSNVSILFSNGDSIDMSSKDKEFDTEY
ncbi:hypothetical protein U9M48_025391 [Paspalum notatum var. saurae]|uniref:Uncharacterized protein n=1 Tax=Paspalum notatum var. saurae TaxID=547442 RepID=A0AAQ3WXA1_PASNO